MVSKPKTVRLLDHLELVMSADVRPTLAGTVRQLHEWTGGHPVTVSGANPSSAPTPIRDDDEAVLSKLEAEALTPDKARHLLARLKRELGQVVAAARRVLDELGVAAVDPLLDADGVPPASGRSVAYILWSINQIRVADVRRAPMEELEHMVSNAERVAAICALHRPPPPTAIEDVCHAHARAGGDATIAARYRRWQLCRWCGDFRSLHGVNPPPKAVRMHDRGQKVTPSMLRQIGVEVR